MAHPFNYQNVHEGMEVTVDPERAPDSTANCLADVVHVFGMEGPTRVSLRAILDSSIRVKRELTFSVNMTDPILWGTKTNVVEDEALRFLRGLTYFRQNIKDRTERPIVFVAYDFGALVLKKAIAISGGQRGEWSGIFSSTARLIFYECFHRNERGDSLYHKIGVFVERRLPEPGMVSLWDKAIYKLSRAATLTTQLFLESKITLRSRVISLYANKTKAGSIDEVFDYGIATIGHPTEYTIEEGDDSSNPFPDLDAKIRFDIGIEERNPEPSLWGWEDALRSLAPRHHQLRAKSPEPRVSVLKAPEYKRWRSTRGVHMLYIHGKHRTAINAAAEQIHLRWQAQQRDNGIHRPCSFYYSFMWASPDNKPTLTNMLCGLLFQMISTRPYDMKDEAFSIAHDQLMLQRAWTEQDLIVHILDIRQLQLIGCNILLVLQDIDQCSKDSLATFLTALNKKASMTEGSLHIVVTAEDTSTLNGLIPDIHIDYYNPSTAFDKASSAFVAIMADICPAGAKTRPIKTWMRAATSSLGMKELEMMINIIKHRTKWLLKPSVIDEYMFSDLVESFLVNLPKMSIVDKELQSQDRHAIPDQKVRHWILGWIAMMDFRLTRRELGILVYYHDSKTTPIVSHMTEDAVEHASWQVHLWLGGIIDFSSGYASMRDDMRELLESSKMFKEAKRTTAPAIRSFIENYLVNKQIQEQFNRIYADYESKVATHSKGPVMSPWIPGDEILLFSAIRSFPRLLSDDVAFMEALAPRLAAENGPFTSWAKLYWAMDNPFSRRRSPTFTSAGRMLLELGILKDAPYSILESAVPHAFTADDRFALSIREGNEKRALTLFKTVLRNSGHDTNNKGMQVALWRATWLGMNDLVESMLENGVAPDPSISSGDTTVLREFVSPLDMACRLGRTDILKTLIRHGARTEYGSVGRTLAIAACEGHADCLSHLFSVNSRLLEEMKDKATPLNSASRWGQWKVVEVLLQYRFDPDMEMTQNGLKETKKWTPIVSAAEFGHLKTIRALLRDGADPNMPGYEGEGTALSFAAVRAGSAEVVRLLLRSGAEPDHKLISPPLLVQVVGSKDVSAGDKLKIVDAVADYMQPNTNVARAHGTSSIMVAAENRDVATVRRLLKRDAKADMADNQGSAGWLRLLWFWLK
ncbi:putative ankyrin repeat-containing domain protein [Rosellinia necatrix]|uniref:Putative ankyrin repeat-containing domain protein n=1 Tax=Rosellinia necatrix TaxID=77044 RepID=A0A1W2TKC6_ROSNE|nr:putative ankyrin repeat-containing domain protein [Rosellinia necatrix]